MSAQALRDLPLPAGLEASHTVHRLVIISSSKISQKVAHVLRLLDLQTPPLLDLSKDNGEGDTVVCESPGDAEIGKGKEAENVRGEGRKPVLVALVATAAVACKLVTIVEIAKRDVTNRRKAAAAQVAGGSGDGARQAAEKGTIHGPTRTGLPHMHSYCAITGVEAPVKAGPGAQDKRGKKRKHGAVAEAEGFQEEMCKADAKEDESDEEAFETLRRPAEPSAVVVPEEILRERKERLLPVLTLYLATNAVPVLAELYGEQLT